jgi:hypothetical protein
MHETTQENPGSGTLHLKKRRDFFPPMLTAGRQLVQTFARNSRIVPKKCEAGFF